MPIVKANATKVEKGLDFNSAKNVSSETVNVGKKILFLSGTDEMPVVIKKVSFRNNETRHSEFIDVQAYGDANHNSKWVQNKVKKVMEAEGFSDETSFVHTTPTGYIHFIYEKKKK